jgi:hypothetical protein
MIERVVKLTPEKSYDELKSLLFRKNCKITAEEHPKSITVEQGSLWGVSPKGVKKIISFHFVPKDSETRIISISSLASDWIILSISSYVFAGIFIPLFWWLAIDLGERMLSLLSIFLAIVLIVGIILDVGIYALRDSFVEETLRLLP